jgi:hypothetical protein
MELRMTFNKKELNNEALSVTHYSIFVLLECLIFYNSEMPTNWFQFKNFRRKNNKAFINDIILVSASREVL